MEGGHLGYCPQCDPTWYLVEQSWRNLVFPGLLLTANQQFIAHSQCRAQKVVLASQLRGGGSATPRTRATESTRLFAESRLYSQMILIITRKT